MKLYRHISSNVRSVHVQQFPRGNVHLSCYVRILRWALITVSIRFPNFWSCHHSLQITFSVDTLKNTVHVIFTQQNSTRFIDEPKQHNSMIIIRNIEICDFGRKYGKSEETSGAIALLHFRIICPPGKPIHHNTIFELSNSLVSSYWNSNILEQIQ